MNKNSGSRDAVFLHQGGDPRSMLVYKLSVHVSQVTEYFVLHYVDRKSRTADQMQQAARSCKQNIIEGCEAAKTSKETEIKLTNVARASLAELLEDYMDALLFSGKQPWGKEHPRILRLREFIKQPDFASRLPALLPRLNKEELCNLAITLIKQTQYLLDRLLLAQQRRFLEQGGIREQMTRARIEYRNQQRNQSNWKNWNNQSDWNNQNNRKNQSDWNNQNNWNN